MTRAWLILADILVMLLLFFSFILLIFYPVKPLPEHLAISMAYPRYNWEQNITFDTLQMQDVYQEDIIITQKELKEMAEDDNTAEEIIQDYLFSAPVKERLTDLSAKVGDPLLIRIFKSESLLEVWIRSGAEYKHLKNYFICAYSGGLGPKLKEGDKQSPEGFYTVKKHQLNPKSKFHLSFNLGYPNAYDQAHKRTGSFLMVHGNCVSIGCYAMTDEKIEEIYALVKGALAKGQKSVPVHAFPFKMTEENMAVYADSDWYDFWVNLKEGYDYFEVEKLPPSIQVKNAQYVITETNE
jgi:murein L,D-transpeptidase YafK